MVAFINGFHKVFAWLSAIMLFVTGALNMPFNGQVAKWESQTGVVGLESLTRAQGVTNDGEHWFFSGKNYLESVDIQTNEVTAINLDAIPEELATSYGSAHIGGISYANGYIYAGVEDSKIWEHPLVVLYDAKTLAYTGIFYEMPTELFVRGIPWVIADAQNGVLYSASSKEQDKVYVFDLQTLALRGEIAFSKNVESIQGGEYADGYLYVGTNDSLRSVARINVETGEVETLFSRIAYEYKLIDNFGGEGEDVTVLSLPDGTYIHTLQLGVTFTDATLRHYK